MTVAQAWLLIGVPGLALALVLLLDRSPVRAGLGYLVLFAAFAGLAVVDRASAAVLGAGIALMYAAGRGGDLERERLRDDEIGVPEVAVSEGQGHVGTSRT